MASHVNIQGQGFRFATFQLDADGHRLTGPDGDIGLRPKSFDVLALLLARAGQLVTKDEILQAVWPDVVVTDDSLTRCISDVRQALKDHDRALIKTVAKRGYRIDVSVAAISAPGSPEPAGTPTGQRPPDTARSAGGRRLATAVYVDVGAEIEALASGDPEAALGRYEALVAQASQVLREWGATVQLWPGEGLAGLFGVPVAQEDHAERACQAALRCQALPPRAQQAASLPLTRLRIGIASGSVVFRPLDGVPGPEWSAMGSTLNEARRLGRAAELGDTLIAASTRRVVEGRFTLADFGAEPAGTGVGAWRLTGSLPNISRFKAAMARGLTRFVGRESELAQLQRAQRQAAAGRGQIVALVGEAGVGKSRLVHELVQSLDPASGWRVLDGAAVPYGTQTSYLPMTELLQRCLRIEAQDDAGRKQACLRAHLCQSDSGVPSVLAPLQALLELPVDDESWPTLDPGQRRFRTLEAIVQLLQHEAAVQPCVLFIEDMHWADVETLAVLDALVDALPRARLLLLLTYRPDFRHGWVGRSGYTQIRLDALGSESSARMLDLLLGHDPALERLKQMLVRRGNPFFLEEAVRSLVDSGALAGEPSSYRLTQVIDAIRIPATVEAMLAARIDHLEPDDRRIVEVAAVLGKVVPLTLMAAVTGLPEGLLLDTLHRLQKAEFLDRVVTETQTAYVFRHALVQEVAYGGLLQARRRELHARAFEALEAIHGDAIGEHTERLAHHASRGELGAKAVQCLRQAGMKAAARSALSDARSWFEQALEVHRGLPLSTAVLELGYEIRLALRGVLYQLGEPHALLACLREAEAMAEELGDERRRVRVAAFTASVHTMLGQLDAAVATGQAALEAARRHGELELRINAANFLVQAHYYRGDYQRVLELAAESLADWPDHWAYRYHLGNPAPASVFNRAFMAMSLAQLGRFGEAAAYESQAIALAEPTQNAFAMAVAHVSVPTLHPLRGDWPTARTRVERFIEVARTGHIVGFLSTALAASAWILAQSGKPGEAAVRIEEAGSLLERQAAHGIGNLGGSYCSLGRACLALGRIEEAKTFGRRALELSPSLPGIAAHALVLLGDVACHQESVSAEGEAYYGQAMSMIEPRGMRPLAARCHAGLAAIFRSRGRSQEANEHARACAAVHRELSASHL